MSFRPFVPADGPNWLQRLADSIADLFRRIMPAPLRVKDYATAALPSAAAFKQGLVYDSDDDAVKYSDGTAWAALSRDGHRHSGNACMASKAADEAALDASGAGIILSWDREQYDDGGWHDSVIDNSRLTVPAGVTRVRVGLALGTAEVAAGIGILVYLSKNGSPDFVGRPSLSFTTGPAAVGPPMVALASGPLAATAGDYFQAHLVVSADSSIAILAAVSAFWIEAC